MAFTFSVTENASEVKNLNVENEPQSEREGEVQTSVVAAVEAIASVWGNATLSVNFSGTVAPVPENGDSVSIELVTLGAGETETEGEEATEGETGEEGGVESTDAALLSTTRTPNPDGNIAPTPGQADFVSPGNASGVPGISSGQPGSDLPKPDLVADPVPPAQAVETVVEPTPVDPAPAQTTSPATPAQEPVITQAESTVTPTVGPEGA